MIMLEDSLREMFTARVESPPVVIEPAAVAIRRGRSARRRQVVGSLLAVAAALVLTVGGVMSVGGWPPGRPGQGVPVVGLDDGSIESVTTVEPFESSIAWGETGIGLDLRIGDDLWTSDGRRLSLAGVGDVTRVYRVPAGWVYAGADTVRFLRPDGTSLSLSGEDDRWVLSADGHRIAFLLDTTLYVARIGPAGMAVLANVEVPAGAWPVALTANQVVISDRARGYGLADLRQPAEVSWNADVTAVYGARGNGFAGLVPDADGSRHCLASLTAPAGVNGAAGGRNAAETRLTPVGTGGCGLGLGDATPTGWLAPGGDWLAEQRASEVAMINVGRALDGRSAVVSCPVASSVVPAWADPHTLVAGDERRVVRCRTDGTEQVVPLPDGVTEDWHLVPRLMAEASD